MSDILLIEDDFDLCEILNAYLTLAGFNLTIVNNGADALTEVNKKIYHLILLDLNLPDSDGFSICKKLREHLSVPIIFISGINDRANIVKALKIGGDDYLVKPFDYEELIARIEANLRRVSMLREASQAPQGHILHFKTFDLDLETKRVFKKNQSVINLSPLEFNILYYMVQHPNLTLSYEDIYRNVWHEDSLGDVRTVMVHVSNLRKKIKDVSWPYIHTVRKRGYMFIPNQ